jgi:hypothetical protein
MSWVKISRRVALVAAVVLLGGASSPALSQQKESLKAQLVGTWALRSMRVIYPDGRINEHPYGPHGKGIIIFQGNGHFALVLTNPDVPKYASNQITKPTTQEAMAAALGTFAFFGTYSVDEGNKSFIFHIEGSSFPNFVGANQKRIVTRVTPDALEFVNLTPPSGGPKAELAYQRVE